MRNPTASDVVTALLVGGIITLALYGLDRAVDDPPLTPPNATWKIDCWRGADQHEVHYSSSEPQAYPSGALSTEVPMRWFSGGTDCIVTKVESSK